MAAGKKIHIVSNGDSREAANRGCRSKQQETLVLVTRAFEQLDCQSELLPKCDGEKGRQPLVLQARAGNRRKTLK
jgi:hypothetical protein